MAENNLTADTGGSFWSKLGSMVADKAVDLADSYAALKLGKDNAKAAATGAPPPVASAPSTAPAAPQAPNNKLLWIGGALVLVAVVFLLRPRSRR